MVSKLTFKDNNAHLNWLVAIVAGLVVVRLVSLGLYPLFDMTESRYGEIARLMFETGNWVTPQIDYGVPFWGKPPLNTWASAVGYQVLGVNEFAARFPHFLFGLLTSFIVFRFVKSQFSHTQAYFSILVLWSSLGFVLAIGMVMTDSALLLSYTLAMCSFWLHFTSDKKSGFGHLFFAALALGMLAKGPVMVVFTIIALVLWSLWDHRFLAALASLPWLSGLLLFATLTLPWYIWAEVRTPGFLEYFIVGEHISRFLEPGWSGDLYGSAHDKPKGSIWLFALVCAFPWSFWIVAWALKNRRRKLLSKQDHPSLDRYLIAWMCAPLILFTFAGNILPIYSLPGFTAMAILIARHYSLTKMALSASALTLLLLVAIISALNLGVIEHKSQARLLSQVANIESLPIYYWKKRPFSGQFYSRGKAKIISSEQDLSKQLDSGQGLVLVVAIKREGALQLELGGCQKNKQSRHYRVYRCGKD